MKKSRRLFLKKAIYKTPTLYLLNGHLNKLYASGSETSLVEVTEMDLVVEMAFLRL